MHRIRVISGGLALLLAFACTSAAAPRLITQAASGKTFRLVRGDSTTLRLSGRWSWSTPRVSTKAIELTPVEYFVDPGYSEWTVDAVAAGSATIKAVGKPGCSGCALTVRSFRVTVLVGSR